MRMRATSFRPGTYGPPTILIRTIWLIRITFLVTITFAKFSLTVEHAAPLGRLLFRVIAHTGIPLDAHCATSNHLGPREAKTEHFARRLLLGGGDRPERLGFAKLVRVHRRFLFLVFRNEKKYTEILSSSRDKNARQQIRPYSCSGRATSSHAHRIAAGAMGHKIRGRIVNSSKM